VYVLRRQSDSISIYTIESRSDALRNLPGLGLAMAGRLDAKQLIIEAVSKSALLFIH
jgi:hypothetical protein